MTAPGRAARRGLPLAMSLGLIGILAAGMLLFATPWGLGLGGDSYYYVSGARGLLTGQGFSRLAADGTLRPITHFPPLYSVALAAVGGMGIPLIPGARALQALLFGANSILVGWLAARGSGRLWLGAACALLFGLAPAMLAVHSWLLSEGLFLFLELACVVGLVVFLGSGRRQPLLAAAVAAGLAVMTRYAGLALVVAGGLVLIVLPGRRNRQRWLDVGLWLAWGMAGWMGWSLRNMALSGSITNRELSLHVPPWSKLGEALTTLARWILPARFPIVVGGALAIGVALVVMVVGLRRLARSSRQGLGVASEPVLAVCLSVCAAYPLLVLVSLVFADASTPLDDRILSPMFTVGLVAAACIVGPNAARPGLPRRLVMLGIGGLLALTLARGMSRAAQLRQDGQGYAARAWRDSQVIGWVADLSPEITVYSNELDALYLLVGRQAYQVPIRWDPVQAEPRADFVEQLEDMQARVARGEAVLVLFNTLSSQQAFLPSEEELADGLARILQAPDGVIYGAAP